MEEKKDYARDAFRDSQKHCAIFRILQYYNKFCSDGDCRNCNIPLIYFLKPEKVSILKDTNKIELTKEQLADFIHEAWMSWAKNIMKKETLSQDRCARWEGYFVPYDELEEDVKDQDREQVELYLDKILGEDNEDS